MSEAGLRCWWCYSSMADDDRFCRRCGAADLSRRNPPSAPAELLWPTEGENRPLTVLFPDVTGYMATSSKIAGDDAAHLVNTVQGIYVRAIVEEGGFIARCVHDEVLALFGVPVAREDDEARAVHAALAIREALHAIGFEVKMGIESGLVYFGPVGSALHSELAVVGPAADIAARLVGKGGRVAEPGQILVGESVQGKTRGLFRFGAPKTLTLKGIPGEVKAFDVLGTGATGPAGREQGPVDPSGRIHGEIHRVERPARQLLQVASAIGDAPDRRLLEAVAPSSTWLDRWLSTLVAAGLLVVDGGAHAAERLRFRDEQTRGAAYASLLRARRASLHARLAELLDQLGDAAGAAAQSEMADAHGEPPGLASGSRT